MVKLHHHLVFWKKISIKLEVEPSVFSTQKSLYYTNLIKQLEEKMQLEDYTEKEISTLHLALYETLSMDLQVKVFNLLMHYYIQKNLYSDAQKLYELCEKIIPLETELTLRDKHDIFTFYSLLGNYFYRQQQYHSADYYYTKAKDYGDKSLLQLAKIFYNVSLTKQRILDDMHISLIYAKQAYDLFEKEKNHREVIAVLVSMAVQYTHIKNFEAAKNCLETAQQKLHQYPETQQKSIMFMMEYHYGKLFEVMGNDDVALQKYITLTNTLEEDASVVYVLQSMVNLYFKQKQWVQVQMYCDRAMNLAERFQMNYIYIQLMIVRANVLQIRQDDVGYEKELKKALTLAKTASLSKLIKEIAYTLGDYYMEQRFYKKSSEYYKMALLVMK